MDKLLALLLLFNLGIKVNAQSWKRNLYSPNANFFTLQRDIKNKIDSNAQLESSDYNNFKRWCYSIEYSIPSSGSLNEARANWRKFVTNEFPKIMEAKKKTRSNQNWHPIKNNNVAGRVNFIRLDPTNNNILYAGTPKGGLWKSINGGDSWNNLTQYLLPTLGCSDLAINPLNPNELYLATGDNLLNQSFSNGIYKSTDGGITWTQTSYASYFININTILIDPINPQILIVGSDNAIARTVDGGLTWTTINTGVTCLAFNPLNHNTIYATTDNGFSISYNNGLSFSIVNPSLTTYHADQSKIAVTKADTNFIIVNKGSNLTYRSFNQGSTFTNCNYNASNAGGNFNGIATAISPTNASQLITTAIFMRVSNDYGENIINPSPFQSLTGANSIDLHDIVYDNSGNTVFIASDLGVQKIINLSDAINISSNLQAGQVYDFDQSEDDADFLVAGYQDEGHRMIHNNNILLGYNGDCMTTNINNVNDEIGCKAYQAGSISGTTNKFITTNASINLQSEWYSKFIEDPNNPNILYFLKRANPVTGAPGEIHKSTNNGMSWTMVYQYSQSAMAIAPSNSNIIYFSGLSGFEKTVNAFGTTSSISTPAAMWNISSIAIDPIDANKLYIVGNGYVYKTTNGGSSWSLFNNGLPAGIGTNSIVIEKGSDEKLYLGTSLGVYFYNKPTASWEPFMSNLPNVEVNKLKIFYKERKIRASTFGSGIWECNLKELPSEKPFAMFHVDKKSVCLNETIIFSDSSRINPISFKWYLDGSTNIYSTASSINVAFTTNGYHTIKLDVSNANGSSYFLDSIFVYGPISNATITEDFETGSFPNTNWYFSNRYNLSKQFNWQKNNLTGGLGTSSKSMVFPGQGYLYNSPFQFLNYEMQMTGNFDFIYRELDLTTATFADLKFDLAYNYDGTLPANSYDTLRVVISEACGANESEVYNKSGSILGTAQTSVSSGYFLPNANQWRTETIDLKSFLGKKISIALRKAGTSFESIFIDNIKITSDAKPSSLSNVLDLNQAKVYPNPSEGQLNVSIDGLHQEMVYFELYTIDGRIAWQQKDLLQKGSNLFPLSLDHVANGMYYLKIKNDTNTYLYQKIILE